MSEEDCKTANTSAKVLKAAAAPSEVSGAMAATPARFQVAVPKQASSVLHIVDNAVKGKNNAVLRVDLPHQNVPFNHVNINPKMTGLNDPHIPISNGVVTASKGIAKVAKVLNIVNKVMLPVAVGIDLARFGLAVYIDVKEHRKIPKHTICTSSSIAGGWGGGIGGGVAGAKLGALAGGAIGASFGGVGALPGAAIGSIVGGILGGIGCGVAGSLGGDKLAQKVLEKVAPEQEKNDECEILGSDAEEEQLIEALDKKSN